MEYPLTLNFDEKLSVFCLDVPEYIEYDGLYLSNKIKTFQIDLDINSFSEFLNQLNFPFVLIFDLPNNKICLVRDIFGRGSLFYNQNENEICISSKLSHIVNWPGYSKKINHREVFNYIENCFNYQTYSTDTIWENIYTPLPGYITILNKNTYENFRFFSVPKVLPKDNLLKILESSIKTKVSHFKNIASQLSGGLDSSSIASFTSNILNHSINTIEFRTEGETVNEEKFALDVASKIGSNHFKIQKFPNIVEAEFKIIKQTYLPDYMNVGSALDLAEIELMLSEKIELVLTGHDGDSIFNTEVLYLKSLFDSNNIKELKSELFTKEKLWENQLIKKSKLFSIFIKEIIREDISINGFYSTFKLIIKKKLNFYYFVYVLYLKLKNIFKINTFIVLNAKTFDLKNRNIQSFNNFYIKNIFSNNLYKLVEQLSAISKSFGVKYDFPFFDINILAFVSNSSMKFNFYKGYNRGYLRDAMKDYLPESVYNRVSKTDFSNISYSNFKILYKELYPKLYSNELLWKYIDRNRFEIEVNKLLREFQRGRDNKMLKKINRVFFFGIWLDIFFNKTD